MAPVLKTQSREPEQEGDGLSDAQCPVGSGQARRFCGDLQGLSLQGTLSGVRLLV